MVQHGTFNLSLQVLVHNSDGYLGAYWDSIALDRYAGL